MATNFSKAVLRQNNTFTRVQTNHFGATDMSPSKM